MTATFDQLIHRHRMEQEARKAVIVTPDFNLTDTLREAYWKVLTGQAHVVVQFPITPGGAA